MEWQTVVSGILISLIIVFGLIGGYKIVDMWRIERQVKKDQMDTQEERWNSHPTFGK